MNRLASNYLREKTVLKSELLEAQARLAQEEQHEIVLSNQLATEKEQLNYLMGRNLLTEFGSTRCPETTALENDLGGGRNRALQQRPEVREAKLRMRQAEVRPPDQAVGIYSRYQLHRLLWPRRKPLATPRKFRVCRVHDDLGAL